MAYPLPATAASVLEQHANRCQHLGLILTRYPTSAAIEDSAEKGQWLRARVPAVEPPKELVIANYSRWEARTQGALVFTGRALTRLVVGLGGNHVLETGLTLDYVTGLPFIPGSALKGLTRNYALLTLAAARKVAAEEAALTQFDEHLMSDEAADLSGDEVTYREVFGSQGQTGVCIFHDACYKGYLPNNNHCFEVDVMTPHFRRYYESSGKQAPHDADNPNPIVFATVGRGIRMSFAVGRAYYASADHREMALGWLKAALREMGIGGKTAAGYGVFEEVKKEKSEQPA